ncbi:MAG TPA: hypothetical protein VK968_04695, partial [Roseimicrobium sp.]|nr:hypothetical protein [Roseimicrobium sp.]
KFPFDIGEAQELSSRIVKDDATVQGMVERIQTRTKEVVRPMVERDLKDSKIMNDPMAPVVAQPNPNVTIAHQPISHREAWRQRWPIGIVIVLAAALGITAWLLRSRRRAA